MAINDFYPNNINYGPETFARLAPEHVDVRVLTASSAEVHTIPSDTKYVIFSSTSNFYAKIDAAASVPSSDVTDGSGSELNPAVWYIDGKATIGVVSPSSNTITLSFYK